MPKKPQKLHHKVIHHTKRAVKHVHKRVKPHAVKAHGWYKRQNIWRKIAIWMVVAVFGLISCMYGVARWYVFKHRKEPLTIGASFIPQYARYLDLDPQATMDAMINDLGIRRFRLVSYWEDSESTPGHYDFSDLDWEFNKVEAAGGTVSLAIGLRQPRWPECHWPDWAHQLPKEEWQARLKDYMKAVIERYKDRPSLQSYQLENEYFLDVFGDCPDHSRDRLVDEFNFVKELDPDKPIVVSRSNNAIPSWPIGQPRADIIGASIYKRVWDRTITKRYFEYPFPPWFYSFLAGAAELTTGRNTIIHEMQTEAWPPENIKSESIEEQDKSLNAAELPGRIQYGVDTGMKTIDLWGIEWWYWRKVKFNDPGLWDAGKNKIQEVATSEKQCPGYYETTPNGFSKAPC